MGSVPIDFLTSGSIYYMLVQRNVIITHAEESHGSKAFSGVCVFVCQHD